MKLGVQSGTLIGTEGWVINRKENISERRLEQTGDHSVCYHRKNKAGSVFPGRTKISSGIKGQLIW